MTVFMRQKIQNDLKRTVASDFGKAAATYDTAARLQRVAGEMLLDMVPAHPVSPVLDLGCGTGLFLASLQQCYPKGQLLALDLSEGMISHARKHRDVSAHWLVGDADALPMASASVELVFSSLVLQWCPSLEKTLAEIARVLKPGGICVFTTLLDGTLKELNQAWQTVDAGQAHVNQFLGPDEVRAAGKRHFDHVELKTSMQVLSYENPLHLLRELKALGARHKGDNRRRSLTGARRLQAFQEAYRPFQSATGEWPASYRLGLVRLRKD